MRVKQPTQPTDDEPTDEPPDAAEFVYTGGGLTGFEYDPEWAEDPAFEPPEPEPDAGEPVSFESGDTVPRAVVEETWSSFSDLYVPLDDHGVEIPPTEPETEIDAEAADVAALETRLADLEAAVADHRDRLDALEGDA